MVQFTKRELQVLKRMFVEGKGLHKIGKEIGVSTTRVRHIRDRVKVKLTDLD
ncbi:sigma factor-like helix-turn-helix DNA-binding protein [Paenibacillus glufosinatiresistens]|uniref:sigma factor-like helix-turn-helix DNA-binding protein n=1 Tax=Paenibacillus glufosinatiresistens TaxID=3070657 RepID=UPI00286DDE8E|nr:sigma factor-like helix-turn-helix DNA-binding protein [Paenibacillus sp. YX.27]